MNRLQSFSFLFFILQFFSFITYASDTLYLKLDMHKALDQGWFNASKETVGIRGDVSPLSWSKTFKAYDQDGDFMYDVKIPFELKSDSLVISLKIKVDGADNPNDGWQDGRNHKFKVYKRIKNKYELAWEDLPPEPKSTATGNVQIIENFKSKKLANRVLHIYLPPDYAESNRSYPVLYMHDGQMLFDEVHGGSEWRLDEAAENLMKTGEIKPMIIVGVGNTLDRIDEYTPTRQVWEYTFSRVADQLNNEELSVKDGTYTSSDSAILHVKTNYDTLFVKIPGSEFWQHTSQKGEYKYYLARAGIDFEFVVDDKSQYKKIEATKPPMGGNGEQYTKFLLEKVMPYIEEKYRVKKGPENTSLGGSSLGGLITMDIGLKNPDKFGQLLVISPSIWWDDKVILNLVEKLRSDKGQRIFLYVGTNEGEGTIQNARELYNLLQSKDWPSEGLEYIETIGAGHSEKAWAKQAENMLRFLFAK